MIRMRLPLIALAFTALLTQPAASQIAPYPAGSTNQSSLALIAPTPASPTENSNRIATTAWVQSFVNAGLPLAGGKIWVGSAGNIATPQIPSGDLTMSNVGAFTFNTVNGNVGAFGSATQCATVTVNAKGLTTATSQTTCTPALGSITGFGTGIAAALAIATGNAGAPVLFNGALGTPSSGNGSNLTALNATQLTTGTLPAARTNGHLNGEPGTGSAAAGEVGEYNDAIVTSASPIALTSATPKTVTSVTLGAGDWDISGIVYFSTAASTSVTATIASLSATTNTLDTTPGRWAIHTFPAVVPGALTGLSETLPRYRLSLGGSTTIFLTAQSTFTVSSNSAWGMINYRRAR